MSTLLITILKIPCVVMGIEEGTWYDEHWVLSSTNESLNIVLKTKDVLYLG